MRSSAGTAVNMRSLRLPDRGGNPRAPLCRPARNSRCRAWIRVLVLCSCAAAGCADPPSRATEQNAQPVPAVPRPFTEEALDLQSEMSMLKARTPADSSLHPATTLWSTAPSDLPTERAATPGALIAAVVVSRGWNDALGDAAWEQTTRVFVKNEDRAFGVVLLWDFLDDAVAGHDFRLSMVRNDGMWRVDRLEQRYHCRRMITADGQCG
jgi:hypothetical protein